MKKLVTLLILLLVSLIGQPTKVIAAPQNASSQRQALSGADVISAINGYRQQYGIAPLTQNSLLSSLAQGQSDYQASLNTVTHTGPGGTTPQERAAAAGYGGSSFFYLSEIIYGGYQQTVQDALVWWQNSSLHNSIMLNSKYTEVGAGVATNGDSVYFTAVLGGPSGGSSSSGSGSTSGSGDSENTQTTQSAPIVMSVQKATAQPDGSIIHTVLTGQTLWTIAAVYQVELNKLLELNGLNQYSYVFPGDQIIVRPAGQYQDQETTLTTTLNPSLSGTPDPQNKSQVIGEAFSYQDTTPTPVSPTSTPVVVRINRAPTLVPEDSRNLIDDPVVRNLIIAALIILIIVMVVSSFIQKPATRPPKDEQLD